MWPREEGGGGEKEKDRISRISQEIYNRQLQLSPAWPPSPTSSFRSPQSSCTSERLATGKANQESPRLCPRPPGGSLLSQDLMRCQDEWASIDKFPYGCDTCTCCAPRNRNQRFPYERFTYSRDGTGLA